MTLLVLVLGLAQTDIRVRSAGGVYDVTVRGEKTGLPNGCVVRIEIHRWATSGGLEGPMAMEFVKMDELLAQARNGSFEAGLRLSLPGLYRFEGRLDLHDQTDPELQDKLPVFQFREDRLLGTCQEWVQAVVNSQAQAASLIVQTEALLSREPTDPMRAEAKTLHDKLCAQVEKGLHGAAPVGACQIIKNVVSFLDKPGPNVDLKAHRINPDVGKPGPINPGAQTEPTVDPVVDPFRGAPPGDPRSLPAPVESASSKKSPEEEARLKEVHRQRVERIRTTVEKLRQRLARESAVLLVWRGVRQAGEPVKGSEREWQALVNGERTLAEMDARFTMNPFRSAGAQLEKEPASFAKAWQEQIDAWLHNPE
jgi:hypothetical protein